jgi:hypothetical protein
VTFGTERAADHRVLTWFVLLGARLGGLAGEVVERRRSLRLLDT